MNELSRFTASLLSFTISIGLSLTATARETLNSADDLERLHRLFAIAVAHQPRSSGVIDYLTMVGVKADTKSYLELHKLGQLVQPWPSVRVDGDTLMIGNGNRQVRVEVLDLKKGLVSLNGRSYTVNPNRSLLDQAREALSAESSARFERQPVFQFLIPEAVAQNAGARVSRGMYGTTTIVGGLFGGFVAIMSAGVAGGAALYAGIGAGVSAVACSGLQFFMHGNTFSQRYKNCALAPLSWVNANPQDRLYLSAITACSANGVSLTVESPSGFKEKRTFKFKNEQVNTVLLESRVDKHDYRVSLIANPKQGDFASGSATKDNKVTSTLSLEQLQATTALLADAQYYRKLCTDPKRIAQVLKSSPLNVKAKRAWDRSRPDQIQSKSVQ